MRTILTVLFWWIALAAPAQSLTPKVIIVIADGIPADVVERLRPPVMQSIIDSGIYTRAFVGGHVGSYTETPTISAPGYNDMLTGVWGYKHNVWDNDNQHPNYHYPSIFRVLRTARPNAKTAIFSTWIENRKTLLGEGLPATGRLSIDYVFDGYEKDTVQFPHDRQSHYLHLIDEHVVSCADSMIRAKGPDLSWIYLEYTDDVGHAKGTGAAFDSAIGMLDNQLKKITEAIAFRERQFAEKWLLVVTTDHGRDSVSGAGHGGQSARERTTWMILNKPVANEYVASQTPGIVDILPSVCRYFHVNPPVAVARELDGVPMIGAVSIHGAELGAGGDTLHLSWKAYHPREVVKVYLSYTNDFAVGKPDRYQLIGTARAGDQSFIRYIPGLRKRVFYKIVLEGKSNTINVWHTLNGSK